MVAVAVAVVVVVVNRLPQEAQAYCKEMLGMLQGDLLVLREHQAIYWLLQKEGACHEGEKGMKQDAELEERR